MLCGMKAHFAHVFDVDDVLDELQSQYFLIVQFCSPFGYTDIVFVETFNIS